MPIEALMNLNAGISRQEAMRLFLAACNDTACDIKYGSLFMTKSWWQDNAPELFALVHDPISAEEAEMLRTIVRRERPWKLVVECLDQKMRWADFCAGRLKRAADAVRLARTVQFDYAQRDLWWHPELPGINDQPDADADDADDEDGWEDYLESKQIDFSFLRHVHPSAEERQARTRKCSSCGWNVRAKMVELVSATDGASTWRGWLVTCQNCKRVVEGAPEEEGSDIVAQAASRFDVRYNDLKRELGEATE